MYPSSETLSFFKLFEASGLDGGRLSPLFHFFRIGRTEARNILRSAIVVVLIINVLCRALSFLPLFAI